MSWIDGELHRAKEGPKIYSIHAPRGIYIDALEALKLAREALRVATTPLPEDRQLVISAMDKIDSLGK